jgi:hypothetical protein
LYLKIGQKGQKGQKRIIAALGQKGQEITP